MSNVHRIESISLPMRWVPDRAHREHLGLDGRQHLMRYYLGKSINERIGSWKNPGGPYVGPDEEAGRGARPEEEGPTMALKLSASEKKTLETLRQAYADAATEFNAKRQDLLDLLTEIHGDKQEEFDARSEKWQEGEKGEAARAWLDELQEIQDKLENAEVTDDEFEIKEEPDA